MKVHTRLMKLRARLASPFGEANRPSFFELILPFLFLVTTGSLLESLL
jgi:hypothetical protein